MLNQIDIDQSQVSGILSALKEVSASPQWQDAYQRADTWSATISELYYSQASTLTALMLGNRVEPREDISKEFRELVNTWKSERSATSSTTVIVMHPAYQRIISLGDKVVPFILRELQRETDHWFWALKVITKEDPVPPQYRGNMQEMANAWIAWGRVKGYVH